MFYLNWLLRVLAMLKLSSMLDTELSYHLQDWRSPVYSGPLEIYSTHPGALFGVRIPFQSQLQSPEGNPDSSPPV